MPNWQGVFVPTVEPGNLSTKSLLWAAADTGGTTAVTMVAMLMMARLIGPDAFGQAAVVTGSVLFLNLFVEGLFHDALIQNPQTDDRIFETALSLVLIVAGTIIAAGIVVAVFFAGTMWGGAACLFVGASLSLPFTGALGIGNAKMRRDLIFSKIARASLVGRLAGSVLGLVLAYAGLGAWSLIVQFTGIAIVQTAILYGQSGWRPRLRGSFGTLWPICRFALPFAAMHALVAVRLQGFLIFIAGAAGLSAAGYVNVAFRLTTTPQVILSTAFSNLGLPLLARHQDSPAELKRSFLLLTRMVMPLTVPAFVGLALCADELVPVLLGSGWISVIPLVKVLAFGAAVSFLRFPASGVLRALGHARYSFASACFQLAFTMIGMAVLRSQDLLVAVWLWVLPTVLQLALCIAVVSRVSIIGVQVVLGSLLPTLLSVTGMCLVVLAVSQATWADAAIYRMGAEVFSGAITAMVVLLMADDSVRKLATAAFRKAHP